MIRRRKVTMIEKMMIKPIGLKIYRREGEELKEREKLEYSKGRPRP